METLAALTDKITAQVRIVPEATPPTTSLVVHGPQPLESLLSLEGVNWHECAFGSNQGQIPVVSKRSQAYLEAIAEIPELESYPVQRDELAGLLYRLQGHYWVAGMSDSVAKGVAEDYLEDILPEGFTLAAVKEGIRAWRKNESNKFFPKVGELIAAIKQAQTSIKWRLLRLKKLTEKAV